MVGGIRRLIHINCNILPALAPSGSVSLPQLYNVKKHSFNFLKVKNTHLFNSNISEGSRATRF